MLQIQVGSKVKIYEPEVEINGVVEPRHIVDVLGTVSEISSTDKNGAPLLVKVTGVFPGEENERHINDVVAILNPGDIIAIAKDRGAGVDGTTSTEGVYIGTTDEIVGVMSGARAFPEETPILVPLSDLDWEPTGKSASVISTGFQYGPIGKTNTTIVVSTNSMLTTDEVSMNPNEWFISSKPSKKS